MGVFSLHRLLPLTPENVVSNLGLSSLDPNACEAKSRLGNPSDGGWNVCLFPHPPTSCVIYSFGSNNDFSFEYAASLAMKGCEIHTFDPTMPWFHSEKELMQNHGVYFHHWGVGPSQSFSDAKTLATIMDALHHEQIELVKMDIEGDEWGVLEDMLQSTSIKYVRQLALEVHFRFANSDQVQRVFKGLEAEGFVLWSRLDNSCCSWIIPFHGYHMFHAMELGFVRSS